MSNHKVLMQSLCLVLLTALTAGCSALGYHTYPRDAQEWAVAVQYGKGLPGTCQILSSVQYSYGLRTMSSLGYLDIDRQSETFSAAAMNPLGLKLYEISGSRDGVTTHFMIEPLKRDGVFADAVAQDIMRLYFDLIPPESAEIGKKDSRITFRSRFGAGVLLHTFSEIEGNLVEKKYFEANRLNWRVLYSEYRHRDGTVYPGRIVLHNYRDGYRIDVKVKDMVL